MPFGRRREGPLLSTRAATLVVKPPWLPSGPSAAAACCWAWTMVLSLQWISHPASPLWSTSCCKPSHARCHTPASGVDGCLPSRCRQPVWC